MHITRDFLTCYSCSYYSSMLLRSTISMIRFDDSDIIIQTSLHYYTNSLISISTESKMCKELVAAAIFSYALFMCWINEINKTSRNHYRASHRSKNIKTKQENELLKIISGYILFTSSFYSF